MENDSEQRGDLCDKQPKKVAELSATLEAYCKATIW
jgi:hypothetical protein